MAGQTVKTRIQLKNDTEANWKKAVHFCPFIGEPIIYSADEAHPFFRIKIGDGVSTVNELPFIDAATINGTDINNIVPTRLAHTLTFGANEAFTFDGSADLTVPVYMGNLI